MISVPMPEVAGMLLVGLVVAAASAVGTLLVRRYLLARAVLDIPNERSSHVVPTPRGGGLAIVTVACLAWLSLATAGVLPADVAIALVAGGGAVALVGWFDDRHSVSAAGRLAVHAAAAITAVVILEPAGLQFSVHFGGPMDELLSVSISVIALVWMTNLYNFMDGIDGLAAGEAVLVATVASALAWWRGSSGDAAALLVLGGAAGGFLLWNWPPARIFMGDVGSGFLGMSFGILALASAHNGAPNAVLWILLLGVFVADATITLGRRLWRGERWYAAHRSHAYQRLVQAGWTHRAVTSGALALTAALGALAVVAMWVPAALAAMVVAGAGLLLLAWGFVERRRPM